MAEQLIEEQLGRHIGYNREALCTADIVSSGDDSDEDPAAQQKAATPKKMPVDMMADLNMIPQRDTQWLCPRCGTPRFGYKKLHKIHQRVGSFLNLEVTLFPTLARCRKKLPDLANV